MLKCKNANSGQVLPCYDHFLHLQKHKIGQLDLARFDASSNDSGEENDVSMVEGKKAVEFLISLFRVLWSQKELHWMLSMMR